MLTTFLKTLPGNLCLYHSFFTCRCILNKLNGNFARAFFILITSLFFFKTDAQSPYRFSVFLAPGTSITKTDITKSDNPWAFDLTVKTYWNLPGRFKPSLSISGDLYLDSDKLGYLYPNNQEIPTVSAASYILPGLAFQVYQSLYVEVSGGPAFINRQVYGTLEGGITLLFPQNQRWRFALSYVQVNQREGQQFRSIKYTIGLRLF